MVLNNRFFKRQLPQKSSPNNDVGVGGGGTTTTTHPTTRDVYNNRIDTLAFCSPTKTVVLTIFAALCLLLPLYMNMEMRVLGDFTSDNVAEEASIAVEQRRLHLRSQDSATTTNINLNKNDDKNVIRNLCSTSPEMCSIQGGRSLNECQKPQQSNNNDVKKISGSIYVIPESNFSHDALTIFCRRYVSSTIISKYLNYNYHSDL